MPFVRPNTGDEVAAEHINQYAKALEGSTGDAIPVSLTALNDPTHFGLRVRNLDATNSRGLLVESFNGTVLLQVDINGTYAVLTETSPQPKTWQGQLYALNAPNMLLNPAFDHNVPLSWGWSYIVPGATENAATSVAGRRSLFYQIPSEQWRKVATGPRIPVQGNTSYTVSTWTRGGDAGGGTASVHLIWYTRLGAQIDEAVNTITTTTTWQQVSVTAALPAEAREAEIVLGVSDQYLTGRQVLFDLASFSK